MKDKKLRCPASSMDVQSEDRQIIKCNFFLDLAKMDELDAQFRLLLHLKALHRFYWKRHSRKLVTRFSKRVAMRRAASQ